MACNLELFDWGSRLCPEEKHVPVSVAHLGQRTGCSCRSCALVDKLSCDEDKQRAPATQGMRSGTSDMVISIISQLQAGNGEREDGCFVFSQQFNVVYMLGLSQINSGQHSRIVPA